VSEVTVKNAPKELTDVPGFNETVTVQQTCSAGDLDLLTYSTSYNGIVDTSCIPNTVVPDDASKCQTGKMSPILKGYKTGEVFNADLVTIKKLLQRFGAVHLNVEEEGEEQLLPITVLGWEIDDGAEYWIYTQTYYDGETELVWIDSDDYDFTGLDATVFFNGASVVRAVLSAIVATVVIPALLLFW
ncbi:MAG: hypothetical protein EZS28_004256, partial [Streblomastix strix]